MPPGDDRKTAAPLEHGEVDFVEAAETVLFASGGEDVAEVDAFARHAVGERRAPVDEDDWQPIHEAIDRRPARLGEAEADVDEHERADRDHRRPDGEIVTDQRLLGRVADDHHQHQIEARHLRQRSLAREAKDDEQEAIDDDDAKQRAWCAGKSQGRREREEHQAGKSPALDAPLRALKRIVNLYVDVGSSTWHTRVPRKAGAMASPSVCAYRGGAVLSVRTNPRRTSATLQAWAIQPRGVKGSSASKISLIDPMQPSLM